MHKLKYYDIIKLFFLCLNKMMLKPKDMLYILTHSHTRAFWTRSMDVLQVFLIPSAIYSILNKGLLRFEPISSYQVGL